MIGRFCRAADPGLPPRRPGPARRHRRVTAAQAVRPLRLDRKSPGLGHRGKHLTCKLRFVIHNEMFIQYTLVYSFMGCSQMHTGQQRASSLHECFDYCFGVSSIFFFS